MSVKSRKLENTEATRKALLKVARKLFAERGYAGTATEEVVRRARVTRGALYHHFKDKQDLFRAVLHDEEARLATETATAALAHRDPWSQLIAGTAAFLDACLDPGVRQIVLTDAPAVLGWAGFREIDEAYFMSALKQTLAAAMEAGLIGRQPVEPLAHIIFGATHEAAMLIANADKESSARNDAIAAITRLLEGLRTTSSSRS
ncbi:MAG TPA: TetR family transcriptional regulator [Candidatus Binataceae bacterium]|nr:TetR family transcriptional regulator [Candidatus Binataceae bacterium]